MSSTTPARFPRPTKFDIGDLIVTDKGVEGYVDDVSFAGTPETYAISTFSQKEMSAWWHPDGLTLVQRGPVHAARSAYHAKGG